MMADGSLPTVGNHPDLVADDLKIDGRQVSPERAALDGGLEQAVRGTRLIEAAKARAVVMIVPAVGGQPGGRPVL
jgi:hypothetical protein